MCLNCENSCNNMPVIENEEAEDDDAEFLESLEGIYARIILSHLYYFTHYLCFQNIFLNCQVFGIKSLYLFQAYKNWKTALKKLWNLWPRGPVQVHKNWTDILKRYCIHIIYSMNCKHLKLRQWLFVAGVENREGCLAEIMEPASKRTRVHKCIYIVHTLASFISL